LRNISIYCKYQFYVYSLFISIKREKRIGAGPRLKISASVLREKKREKNRHPEKESKRYITRGFRTKNTVKDCGIESTNPADDIIETSICWRARRLWTLKKLTLKLAGLILMLILTLQLTGCAALVVGGVGAAGGYYYHKGKTLKNEDGSTKSKSSTSTTQSSSTTSHK
jgi:hypothetical protein